MKSLGSLIPPAILIFLWAGGDGVAQDDYGPPPPWRSFEEGCIFLGIAKRGEALIACYYQKEQWSPKGLIIRAILVPTESFPFETGYRGFQKVDPYRVKKGEGLHLTFDGGVAAFSLGGHMDVGDTSPIPVEFVSSEKRTDLIPVDIEKMEFKIRGVARWEKVPRKDLASWSRSFDDAEFNYGDTRRSSASKEKSVKGELPTADEGYRGRYVTLNGTYLFEKKTVYSPIIAVLDAGSYLEFTKPAGGGWMEALYGESQRKGYVLSFFLVDSEEDALQWEREKGIVPIQPALAPAVSEQDPASPTGQLQVP